jgi:DTW domain-containing protein YfiP
MHTRLCFCEHLPTLDTRVRPVWLQHFREAFQTTNTGFLIEACVPGTVSAVVQPGPDAIDLAPIMEGRENIAILFPGEDAAELTPAMLQGHDDFTLVVPDGTWRAASRMVRRDPVLAKLPRVTLPLGPPTIYTLRRASRHHGLSTFEAFAQAMGILEGPEVEARLIEALIRFQDGTYQMKGMQQARSPVTARIDGVTWRARAQAHQERVEGQLGPFLRNRAAGVLDPIRDFLFEYYAFRPAKLRRWDPGHAVLMEDAGAFLERKFYFTLDDGSVMLDPEKFPAKRIKGLKFVISLLEGSESRPPHFACNGMHEWAMCFEAGEDVRHPYVPLRVSPAALDTFVRSHPITCTHYDAFRFFTPPARPLNQLSPTAQTMVDNEQPGCLHTNMDLYRWAHKLHPWLGSDLIMDTFMIALEARTMDMRASPYDMSEYGFEPIRIETPQGQREYRRLQSRLAVKAAPVRRRLLLACRRLLGWVKVPA